MPVIKDDELLSYAGVEIADVLQVDENKPQAEVVVFSWEAIVKTALIFL